MKRTFWLSGLALCVLLVLAVLTHRRTTRATAQADPHEPTTAIQHASRLRHSNSVGKASLPEQISGRWPDSWPQDDKKRQDLLFAWTKNSPRQTARWAESLPHGKARNEALLQVALAWFAEDPQAAWDWVSAWEIGNTRESTLTSLAYELCHQDPAAAFEKSFSLAEGLSRTQLIEHTMAEWAHHNPSSALAQAEKIENLASRQAAIASLATSWAETNPSAAATLAIQSLPPGPTQDRTIAAIVQRWAQQDPHAVQQWVKTFPDGQVKQNALEHIEQLHP